MSARGGDAAPLSTAARWTLALVPLVLLAGVLFAIARLDPVSRLRGDAPPVEVLAFQRVELDNEGILLHVLNDGPDAVMEYFRRTRAAFPDQRNEPIALHHADDAVIAEFWLLGTHLGPLQGVPP